MQAINGGRREIEIIKQQVDISTKFSALVVQSSVRPDRNSIGTEMKRRLRQEALMAYEGKAF